MILLADSGSTKTTWSVLHKGKSSPLIATKGMNPYIVDDQQMKEIIASELIPFISEAPEAIQKVIFYGAGCSQKNKCEEVSVSIAHFFKNATIIIEHDLLAAARALCGSHAGLAGILGTGANSCYYNGKSIEANVLSLGYIIGDEGGGVHLGKQLLAAYLSDEMTEELMKKFALMYPMTYEEIIEAIYKGPMPNRFMASFTPFLLENISHKWCHELVVNSFKAYFNKQVCRYSTHPAREFNCLGSVAFNFKPQLEEVAISMGYRLGKIIKGPMDELIKYHLENE